MAFQTPKANIVMHIMATKVTGTAVTLNVTFSSTNNAKCLILPAGNLINTANDVMLHNDATASTHAIGGVETIFVVQGLVKGTQYIAKCAQNDVLSEQVAFTTLNFLVEPSVTIVSSTSATFKMTPSGDGEISWEEFLILMQRLHHGFDLR